MGNKSDVLFCMFIEKNVSLQSENNKKTEKQWK